MLITLLILLMSLLPAADTASRLPQQQATPDGLCFAQYEWTINEAFPDGFWNHPFPGNTLGAIDLRSLPQMTAPGPVRQGYGLFALDDADACVAPWALVSLGSDLDATLRPLEVLAIEAGFGLLPGDLGVETPREIVRELLTTHADASGTLRWKPVRGSAKGGFTIELGGYGQIVNERFDATHPSFIQTILVFQVDYQRHLNNGMQADDLQRFTGAAMLGIFGEMSDTNADILMAAQHRGRGWRDPDTSIADDFEVDSSANWTADNGGLTVDAANNGYLEASSAELIARHNTALSSDEHYAEVTLDALAATWQGPMTRKATSATQTYYVLLKQGTGTAAWQFFKRVGGSYTFLAQWEASLAHSDGDVYRLTSNGSDSHSGTKNGTPMTSSPTTDTSITGELSVGLVTNSTATDFEAFGAADLAAPPVSRRVIFVR